MTITNSSLRLVALVAGVAVALALMGAVAIAPAQAAGLTQTQIQSIVSLLASFGADTATINNVTAALNGQATTGTTGGTTTTTTGGSCPALSRDLQVGSSGADVKALQVYLNSMSATQVAASGAGSAGNETMTFGPATKAAVVKLQTKLSVTPASGYVGAKTRAAIAAACGGSTTTGGTTGTTGGTTTGGALTVSAAAQPVNSLAPQGASRVPFTTFTLTNNSSQAVTINSVTVQRVGLGVDSNLSGIVLLDANGLQIGTAKTLNSNHQANIGDTWTLAAGASQTLTVAGNIATGQSTSGQVIGIQVVAVNTSATVSGSLPINGASQTINTTLTLGSVSTSTSSFDPGAQNKSIGDTAVRTGGLRFTAGSAEDLKLYSIRWRQIGTASASDLANVMTVVDSTSYPTTVSADGKYYTTIFPGGLLIAKGNSVDVYNKVDIVGSNAAGRSVQLTIDRVTDVYFVGQTYGYGVAPSGTLQPWYNGSITSIQAGSATTIGKATEVIAQNVAVNLSNQPLGGFVTDFKGEAVSVQGMTFTVASTSGSGTGLLTNVSIVDSNGTVVAGPVDATYTNATTQTLTFTDTVTFPTKRMVYTLKGKVASTIGNGTQYTVSTTPSSWTNPQGQVSGSTVTLSQGAFSMNTMTVKGAALAIGVSATPSSQTVTAGSQQLLMANVLLDASQSGEDVRISALPIRLTVAGGAAVGDLSSCTLFNGSTQLTSGSNVPTALASSGSATNFTLDNTLTIPKGTVMTISVKCNVSSAATGTYVFSVNNADNWGATGFTSGTSITETGSGTSGTFSIGNASVALTIDSSSPSLTLAAGGQTGVTLGVYKLRATNDVVNLTKLGLTLTSGTDASLSTVYIYQGATLVGTATFLSGSTVATSTLSTPVALAKDTDTTITIKADLADIGSSVAGVEGALVKLDPNSSEGNASSGLVQSGATTGVAGVRVYNTYPVIALDTLGSTGVGDGRLMHFKVTANSQGSLGIGKFTFTLSTTTLSVSNIQLFGYTDAGYSTAISGQGTSGQIGNTVAAAQNGTAFSIAPNLNAVSVPAGTTYYFELKGSIAGNTTGASVVTTLSGDASASPATGVTPFASVSGNFVWSPNATTTAATSTGNDWTNGFGVAGLPSGGLFQSRGN